MEPIMICKPCRITLDGVRYEVSRDGTVRPMGADLNPPYTYGEPVSEDVAARVRQDAARRRRNLNARNRYDALRSIGMVKTPYGWE
jgi:hypothetical protein